MSSQVFIYFNRLQLDIRRVLKVIKIADVRGLIFIFDVCWVLDCLLVVVDGPLLGRIMRQVALLRPIATSANASFILSNSERSLRV